MRCMRPMMKSHLNRLGSCSTWSESLKRRFEWLRWDRSYSERQWRTLRSSRAWWFPRARLSCSTFTRFTGRERFGATRLISSIPTTFYRKTSLSDIRAATFPSRPAGGTASATDTPWFRWKSFCSSCSNLTSSPPTWVTTSYASKPFSRLSSSATTQSR